MYIFLQGPQGPQGQKGEIGFPGRSVSLASLQRFHDKPSHRKVFDWSNDTNNCPVGKYHP